MRANEQNNRATTNGSNATAQRSSQEIEFYADSLFQKEEVVRLLIQTLNDLGYRESSSTLEKETGIEFESEKVSIFRTRVLEGNWGEVEKLLPVLNIEDNPNVLFLIRQQKFLELLESKLPHQALQTLQLELTTLDHNVERRHFLSSLLVCSSVDEIKAKANWDGASGNSRQILLDELQKHVSPSVMLPRRRFRALLNQAMAYQRKECFYHNEPETVQSLFADHNCGRSKFPSTLAYVIEDHTDEVWHIAFSNSGRFLASASKDHTAKVWSIESHQTVLTLSGHTDSVSYVAWSQNDMYLLTCGNDKVIRLWDSQSGNCLKVLTRHSSSVSACAWLPDNQHFITSSSDKCTFLWNIDGTVVHRWSGFVASDLSISRNGNLLVIVTGDKICLYDLHTKQEINQLQESAGVASIAISNDGNYLLCSVSCQEIHLWDMMERRIIKRFTGYKQSKFVIRSCFGGADMNYVISGSEDFNVYIWRLEDEALTKVLSGHTKMVNAVCWNSVHGSMLASASDDRTIRIWV
ncbi:hypothetical protein DSO57_1011604 [Entomophthora muscae]|uniref:Uncharacterized protein n=1 Tax=Entomophthora muscae TaxID=34485 RepID=A0ACC2UFN5_9FUNG|nr:hypothetical protein DSO57_1011604 [Entomophthora muscae]